MRSCMQGISHRVGSENLGLTLILPSFISRTKSSSSRTVFIISPPCLDSRHGSMQTNQAQTPWAAFEAASSSFLNLSCQSSLTYVPWISLLISSLLLLLFFNLDDPWWSSGEDQVLSICLPGKPSPFILLSQKFLSSKTLFHFHCLPEVFHTWVITPWMGANAFTA